MVVLTLNPSALVIILSWNYILAIHKTWIILRIIERLEDPRLFSDFRPLFIVGHILTSMQTVENESYRSLYTGPVTGVAQMAVTAKGHVY